MGFNIGTVVSRIEFNLTDNCEVEGPLPPEIVESEQLQQ